MNCLHNIKVADKTSRVDPLNRLSGVHSPANPGKPRISDQSGSLQPPGSRLTGRQRVIVQHQLGQKVVNRHMKPSSGAVMLAEFAGSSERQHGLYSCSGNHPPEYSAGLLCLGRVATAMPEAGPDRSFAFHQSVSAARAKVGGSELAKWHDRFRKFQRNPGPALQNPRGTGRCRASRRSRQSAVQKKGRRPAHRLLSF